MKLLKIIGSVLLVAGLVACGGGGGNPGGVDLNDPVAPSTVASIVLTRVGSIDPIPADGVAEAEIVVRALNAGNAAIDGATINLSVSGGGVLSSGQVVTDVNGRASVNVTANVSDQNNRNLVVSASCNGCSAGTSVNVPVRGASVELNPATSIDLQVGGAGREIVVTVRGANNALLNAGEVSFASSSPGVVAVASQFASLSNGQARVTVNGLSAGNATLTVSSFGSVSTLPIVVSASNVGLAFTSPASDRVVLIGSTQTLSLNAPGATNVTLATSRGLFSNGQPTQLQAVSGGLVSFVIQATDSGVASLIARDNLGRQASLNLAFSPASANRIILTAPQTSVPRASGGSEPRVVISARALFQVGGVDQPVAGVAVAFQIGAGPGGGERLDPPLSFTNSSGIATTSFIAGTQPTNLAIPINAQIPDTAVRTGVAPSSQPIEMNIGGGALSVAFGPASRIESAANNTQYVMPYSVIVADSSNNPVANQVVTLKMRPFAFSTGPACTVVQTFCSEDLNGNGSLDVGEDGHRISLGNSASTFTEGMCPALSTPTGTLGDGLTPPNSHAGVIPARVTTDSEGLALFDLTYLKAHGLWVVPIMTATVEANGTESSSSTIFRLPVSTEDSTPTTCFLPPSPYRP